MNSRGGTLIVDSGSTKATWAMWDAEGSYMGQYRTTGFNPYYQDEEEIARTIALELMPALGETPIAHVAFYGAGCAFEEKNRLVERAIHRHLPSARVTVESDLLGAARASCGRLPGLAGILGTGSNSCLFDGERIVEHVPPLGFILGDEGSGATIGKRFVGACLKGNLPAPLIQAFLETYQLDEARILERVYRSPFPNRFLASFSPFIHAHLSEPAVRDLVLESFRRFFERDITRYSHYRDYPLGLVGSIAFAYGELVREAAASFGLSVHAIERDPLPGLARYHGLTYPERS